MVTGCGEKENREWLFTGFGVFFGGDEDVLE